MLLRSCRLSLESAAFLHDLNSIVFLSSTSYEIDKNIETDKAEEEEPSNWNRLWSTLSSWWSLVLLSELTALRVILVLLLIGTRIISVLSLELIFSVTSVSSSLVVIEVVVVAIVLLCSLPVLVALLCFVRASIVFVSLLAISIELTAS